ncbi:TPA: hypothetical protein ACIR6E_001166 [Enterobacter roggenkampii]
MSTITKQAVQAVADLKAGYTLGQADVAILNELARIALASLEAEAVGEVVLGEYDDCGCHPDAKVVCIAADGQADWENFKDGTRLYTAPPAPVSVPAAMEMDDDFDSAFEHGKAVGWNAYRAAMLQGADTELQRKAAIHDALCGKYNVESLADFVVWQRNHIAELEAAPPAPVGPGETAVMPDYPGYTMTQRECFDAGVKRAVPDGWIAVPIEPTYEMCKAMGLPWERPRFPDRYKAMIAAAPQQEVKP